jgi:glycerol-3-phosphate dehydrogenase (NAD(P)+)
MQVAVVGAGSWGTAVARLLGDAGVDVRLWARSGEVVQAIAATRKNPCYLTDVSLPGSVTATADLEAAVADAEVIVVATPSHAVRDASRAFAPFMSSTALCVSLAKGLERDTLLRMTEVIGQEIGDPTRAAALSGPNHAEEVSRGIPSTTVVSAERDEVAAELQDLFTTPSFRVYTNPDLVGVELAGASKNVIAVAAGMSDGLGYGDNTKASLMTRGLAEMTRLGREMGANPLTYMGLAGMGDLIATCTSRHSRNRGLGELVAHGGTMDDYYEQTHMVAEGARSAVAVDDLAARMGLELPITHQVRAILYEGASCERAVEMLMTRSSTDELHGLGLIEDEE